MDYNHGIRVKENPTSIEQPSVSKTGMQIIFGTAPINLVSDPASAANKLFMFNTFDEAKAALGYSEDYEKYSLCQSMDATFRLFGVAPVVMCNVLDPAVHKAAITEKTVSIVSKQGTLDVSGILLSSLVITASATTLVKGTDYTVAFDTDGYVLITLLDSANTSGLSSVTVNGNAIDASLVTASDIIGAVNSETGIETGLELIRQTYPIFGIVPGTLLAPGWSQNKTVAAAMIAKCDDINGVFRCECVIDLDSSSSGATKYDSCETFKVSMGVSSEYAILLWPKVVYDGKQFYYSAVYAALMQYTDMQNDAVPSLSPSNKLLGVSASVLADGTEVILDQQQGNILNAVGIVTAINSSGWRAWGNNMSCYPENTDPKDRWIPCRRFFSWWRNTFIVVYADKVDDPSNFRLIEAIVDAENIRGNSLASQGKCAGAKIAFVTSENTVTDILDGKITFRQYLAPWTPAEDILNIIEFDPSMLESAMGGE